MMTSGRIIAACVAAACLGLVSGQLVASTLRDDPELPQRIGAKIDAQVLVDATVIEMHGYGPGGEPGTFLYDCAYKGDVLVCSQREEPTP